MKIALFLKNDKIDDSDIDTIPIIVLHTDSNTVVEIEKDILGVIVRKYDDMKKNPLLRKFIS